MHHVETIGSSLEFLQSHWLLEFFALKGPKRGFKYPTNWQPDSEYRVMSSAQGSSGLGTRHFAPKIQILDRSWPVAVQSGAAISDELSGL